MRRKSNSAKYWLLVCHCFFALNSSAQSEVLSSPQVLPGLVQASFKRAGIPANAIGIYVQQVDTPHVLIAVNNLAAFNPASTMKLVTSAAALEVLGPSFTWKTRAYIEGEQNGDVLNGNLIFKGEGDPKLVIENFWLFLRQIRAQGVREIRGNVILDRTSFMSDAYDPARFDGDPAKPYNVGPDALLLNYKTILLHLVPDITTGTATASVDPVLAGVTVARPQLSSEECGAWQSKMGLTASASRIGFEGKMPAACGEKIWNIHPYRVTQNEYFGAVFRQMWHDGGGSFQGDVIGGSVPPQARLIAERESVALPEVIRDMNKFSNNVIARQLLMTMAAESQSSSTKVAATAERGAQVVKSWLAANSIDNPELIIENGSGLSRIERISASTLGRVLVAAYRAPTMPEFVSSLPIVGLDGTMRRRLQERSVAGRAHIKTGALTDVRAVAGYVFSASGRHYAVVCLVNHVNAPRSQEAQDLLLQWIYENG